MTAPMLLTANDSAEFLGISERLFHELRHTPEFPKARILSQRCVRWPRDALAEYIAKLPTVGAQLEPAQLRRSRAALAVK